MTEKFIGRKDDLTAIEKGVRNKFNWEWLEVKDCNDDFLSDYVRKKVEPGLAHCLYCNKDLDRLGIKRKTATPEKTLPLKKLKQK